MFRQAKVLLTALLLLSPTLGAAQDGTNDGGDDAALQAAEQYADCMRLAAENPGKAIETARTWVDQGGDDPARHCKAIAQFNKGHYAEAARQLEQLAKTMDKDSRLRLRADALAQAGQAWLLTGEVARAEAAQTAALDIAPDSAELWIDRALTRFEMADYWKAIDDLNRASELAPKNPTIYVFRASAYRHVDTLELARDDIDRALDLDPDNAEALLERGIVRRLSSDTAAARKDWLKIIDMAPDSPAAADARANLEKMDVKADGKSDE
jgi:tetratricopeptide (TPR) repeat protein